MDLEDFDVYRPGTKNEEKKQCPEIRNQIVKVTSDALLAVARADTTQGSYGPGELNLIKIVCCAWSDSMNLTEGNAPTFDRFMGLNNMIFNLASIE